MTGLSCVQADRQESAGETELAVEQFFSLFGLIFLKKLSIVFYIHYRLMHTSPTTSTPSCSTSARCFSLSYSECGFVR